MIGRDLDVHAIAADVRHLSEEMKTFQKESQEWRKNITEILVRISDYQTTKDRVLKNQDEIEARVTALEKWQIKIAAIGATALFLIELTFKYLL